MPAAYMPTRSETKGPASRDMLSDATQRRVQIQFTDGPSCGTQAFISDWRLSGGNTMVTRLTVNTDTPDMPRQRSTHQTGFSAGKPSECISLDIQNNPLKLDSIDKQKRKHFYVSQNCISTKTYFVLRTQSNIDV